MYDDKEIGRNRESSVPSDSLSPNQFVPAKFPDSILCHQTSLSLPSFQSGQRNGFQFFNLVQEMALRVSKRRKCRNARWSAVAVERNEEIDYFALDGVHWL
jgi:hypothetical protein